jgi:hypothetical protein
MRVIHGSWLIEIERNRSRTILRLFCYDFTAVALLNDQPSVVGVNARPISKPAETDIRNEFVHAATDGESESLPLKLALRSELILIGIRYLNIGRIGVPTWPVFRIYQIRPNYFGWSINEYLVVNKSIGLFR